MQQDSYQVYSSEIINVVITEWGATYPLLREELKIAMDYKPEMKSHTAMKQQIYQDI